MQGAEASTISVARSRPETASATVEEDNTVDGRDMPLPGPSQVVTHPGVGSRDPVTGQRQRRRGVSGPPTGQKTL